MSAAQRMAQASDGPLLIEVDTQVSPCELHAALEARGLTVITNPKTRRPRVVAIPTYLRIVQTPKKRRQRA